MINLPVMYYKSSCHVTPSDSGMMRVIPLMCAAELIQAKNNHTDSLAPYLRYFSLEIIFFRGTTLKFCGNNSERATCISQSEGSTLPLSGSDCC